MGKKITYENYKSALKNKTINDLFQSAIVFSDDDNKLIIMHPENLKEDDNFFFFVTNYAQRFFQEKLKVKFGINLKDLVEEKFDLTETEISFRGKPFISMKITTVGLFVKKEYNILD